jgi:hypothetical protein
MKCVGNDMQQDKNRATEFAAPIHGTLDQSRVKLLFREIVQAGSCPVFGNYQSGHRWAIFFVPTRKTHVLQMMYPSFLTGQNVHKLFPNGRLAESRNRLVPECLRNGCHMVQQKIQTLVHRTMQFNDSRFGEHDFTLPLRHNF